MTESGRETSATAGELSTTTIKTGRTSCSPTGTRESSKTVKETVMALSSMQMGPGTMDNGSMIKNTGMQSTL